MPDAQGFTPDDRLFCIEHISPDARERLGFYHCDKYGGWRRLDRAGHSSIDFCEYADDAAILAEVVVELWKIPNMQMIHATTHGEWCIYDDGTFTSGYHKSIFTAAASAFRKCKEGE